MSEADCSKKFIEDARQRFGKKIFIRKKMSNMGFELDIAGTYKGMSFCFESKLCNSITYKNNHEFSALQIDELQEREKCGILCLGLLFHNKTIKIVYPKNLKAHFNKDEFLQMEDFEWEKLYLHWKKNILPNF